LALAGVEDSDLVDFTIHGTIHSSHGMIHGSGVEVLAIMIRSGVIPGDLIDGVGVASTDLETLIGAVSMMVSTMEALQ
jgi:hypothetical protein